MQVRRGSLTQLGGRVQLEECCHRTVCLGMSASNMYTTCFTSRYEAHARAALSLHP